MSLPVRFDADRLRAIRSFLLDMDGTIYLGHRLFEFTNPFLRRLRETGRRYVFLTNNSSLSAADSVAKLRRMGVDCPDDGVYTSGDATRELLRARGWRRVYLLGTPSLERDFAADGFELTHERPDAVVLGFDQTLTYEKIRRANDLLVEGVPYLATHPDFVCPFEPHPIPDVGAMIRLFEASCGRTPEVVGKPCAPMYESLERRYGLERATTAMVGDRLYTDIPFGLKNGFAAVLVLSGETTPEMLEKGEFRPDHVLRDLGQLLEIL
jgi:NagD protein